MPPSIEELENRIRHRRSEPEDIIQKRLEEARREMNMKDAYDYVVLNDNVDDAALAIKNIIRSNIKK